MADHDDELVTLKVEFLGMNPITAFLQAHAVRGIGAEGPDSYDVRLKLTRDSTGAPILLAYVKGAEDLPIQVGRHGGIGIRLE